jgi:hypothetical protein
MPRTYSTCHTSRGNESSNWEGSSRKRVLVPTAYRPRLTISTSHARPRARAARTRGLRASRTTYRPMTLNCHGPICSRNTEGIRWAGTGNWRNPSMPA